MGSQDRHGPIPWAGHQLRQAASGRVPCRVSATPSITAICCTQKADTGLIDELSLWYWHSASYDQDFNCNLSDDIEHDHTNHIGTALEALQLSQKPRTDGGHNVGYSIEHFDEDAKDDDGDEKPVDDQYYFVGNKEYRVCTRARCAAWFVVLMTVGRLRGHIIGSLSTQSAEPCSLKCCRTHRQHRQ